jgi:hypothetical protein
MIIPGPTLQAVERVGQLPLLSIPGVPKEGRET